MLRRLDCVLEGTKAAVLAENVAKIEAGLNPEAFLLRKAKQSFYNVSPLDMKMLMGDQDQICENLFSYVQWSATDFVETYFSLIASVVDTPRDSGNPMLNTFAWDCRRTQYNQHTSPCLIPCPIHLVTGSFG